MNVPVPGLMDKLSRIKNSPITHDVLFESAGKKDEFAKALVSLVGPIVPQPGCIGAGVFETWPKRDGFLIEARWKSQEYLVRYLQSQSYKKLLLLAELGSAPPDVEFFTVVEFRR